MSNKSSINDGVGKYTCVVGYNHQTCSFVFKTFNSPEEYEEYCKTHDVNSEDVSSQNRKANILESVSTIRLQQKLV